METFDNSEEIKETLTPVEYLMHKINGSGIKINLNKEQMKEILAAGKEVQKMAVKYGTNLDIQDENSFNGYGTYVVSVNEENAKQLGIKIASRKYGGTFYINNQPLSDFLNEKSFSPYWEKLVSSYKESDVDNLTHLLLSAGVKGNASLEREQNTLLTLLSLDLVEYKREQTYLYSVNIPDNDNTNYLLYNNPIGIEHAQKINEQLEKLGTSWRVSRNDIGKNIYFDVLSKHVFDGNQKKSSEFLKNLGYVGMQMDNANYIVFNDKDMRITDRVQFMKDVNGEVYGFTFEGQIYADEELLNSNVLAHEYTHLWDKYVQNNNPELWQQGKDILKGTSLWQEIIQDKNYENLRTDDEILSECHARMVGKMAEQVLERIAKQDGGLTRDRIIDWDKEVSQYIAEEFNVKPELGSENYVSESIKSEYLKEFLSKPMKDLMNEVKLEKEKKTISFEEAKNLYPNIVDLSEEFNNPTPTEKEVLEKLRSMVGEVYATATEGKYLTVYNSREKNDHVMKGDNYKKDFRKTRETNRKLANNAEKLIHNAEFIEAELPKPEKKKENLLGMHNYEVPVFVNGHGFMVRLEGEVIKNASDYSSGNKALKKTLTSETQLNNNELLLKLQAANVSNLYVVRKQRPLFKLEQKKENDLHSSNVQIAANESINLSNTNLYTDDSSVNALNVQKMAKTINQDDNDLSTFEVFTEVNAEKVYSVLERFSKLDSNEWNVSPEDKVAIFHLINVTKINDCSKEEGISNLKEYFKSEEFEKEKDSYFAILGPLIEGPVTKGEIKSILDNDFTGNNLKLAQDFQDELIEKGIVKPEEKFVLINENEASAKGTKIKPDQPNVLLTIPVNNNGKTEFVATKYYHVSSLEEPQKIEKEEQSSVEVKENDDKNVINGKTKVPEFAMITQNGLESFKDMFVYNFDENSKSYLLKSEKGDKSISISENTLNELTSEQYLKKEQSYSDNTAMAEKMIEVQYNDYFQVRNNCANNFRHNLSVFCRKEANSPLDALKVANSLISQMSKDEKRKTKELLNTLRKEGQSVNEVIIEMYHEAVKEVPLNEDYLKNKRWEKIIARPMYDTLSTKGEKIDRDFNLKIGDSVQTAFKVDKVGSKFSLKKEAIYQNCTIISASKEGNVVTLMDGNKSFYDVPRDTFLKEYAKRQKIENKLEKKVHRQHSMQIDIGR